MDHWTEIYRLMSAMLQPVSFADPVEDLDDESSEDVFKGADLP
ncbi:hypothetical protein [Streptomyces sp. NPDC050164]